MMKNFINRVQPTTLASRVLGRVALRVALVIIIMTTITYYYVLNTVTTLALDQLDNYIVERTQREHNIFQFAEKNHEILKRELLLRLQYHGTSDPLMAFNNKVSRFPDGTHRTSLNGFDGTRDAFVFIGNDVTINADVRRRVITFLELSAEYGRAWHHKFQNVYFTTPENILVGFWPEVPDWAHSLPADMYIPNEEYVWIADKTHNPDRKSVWTDLFYDVGGKMWMTSVETPVDINGRHVATIGHDLTLNDLYRRTVNEHLKDSYNFIISKKGTVIVHPEMLELARGKQGLVDFTSKTNPHIQHVYSAILNNKTKSNVIALDEYDEYIAVGHLEHPDWYFVTVLPRSTIAATAFKNASVILLLGILSLILELFIFYLIIKRDIKKPLEKFMRGVEKVSEGKLDAKLEYDGNDELGAISKAFNGMTQSLLQHEQQLRFNVNMSNAMTSALSTYVTQHENVSKIFNQMLDDILSMTNSEIGFIGEVRYKNGTPYIKTKAITDISWDAASQQRYAGFDRQGMEFHDLNTLYGAAIRTKNVVISNDPKHDSRSQGLRDGHPPLHNFLGVPLILGNKLVGMVSVANRPNGYSQELVDSLQPLINTCASVVDVVRNYNESKATEQALVYEENRLRATFEQAAVGMAHIALDGKWIKANAKLADITGYTTDDLLTMRFYDITHPEDATKDRVHIEKMSKGEINDFSVEKRYLRKDGSVVWVHVTVSLIRNADDTPCHYISIINDISEKISARDELHDALQLLDNIIEHLPNMIFLKHADDLRFKLINRAGEKLLGMGRSEIINRNDYDYFPKHQADYFTNKDREVLAQDAVVEIPEESIDTPLGVRILNTKKIALRNRNGEPEYLLGISEDITERKANEDALREIRIFLEKAQQIARIGSWVWDINSMRFTWSDEMYRIFDITKDEFDGTNQVINRTVHPDDRHLLLDAQKKILVGGEVTPMEYRIVRKDKSISIVWTDGEVVKDKDGNVITVMGTVQDVTEQKLLEAELEGYRHVLEELVEERTAELVTARDAANQANAAKSEFLSRMSHELRTPLNAILGFGQLLELDADKMNDHQHVNVKEIIDAGHHLLTLINEVLDLARIESGKMEMKLEKVVLDAVIKKCITLIENSASEREIEIIDQIKEHNIYVQADEVRLKQVLLNLLGNAVHYNSPRGKITLSSRIIANDRLRICITDTGTGLSKNEINRLFIPFERFANAGNVKGSGIGLVISKHLIELMSGSIGVESAPGDGSTFWIELMLANTE